MGASGGMPRVLRLTFSSCLIAALGSCFSNTPTAPGSGSSALDDAGRSGPFPSAGTVSIAKGAGAPTSRFAFGQNYWNWIDWTNAGTTGLTGTEPLVASLRVNVLRAGGNNNDSNSPSPFNTTEIDKFVAYCRTVGAEPILQVPLLANDVDAGATTAQTAVDMVTYVNGTKGYAVKYWEIGNEPDLYTPSRNAQPAIRSASDYCAQFASYATAMNAAAASPGGGGQPIQFVGPDLAYRYTATDDWLTPFLDGCKDYVDVVSVHRYPFKGSETSVAGALNDVDAFKTTVLSLAAIVQGHARPGTPLAVTEANISYDYALSAYTPSSLVAAPGTFYAGLWTADIMGAALESHLWTLALWNIGEADPRSSVLGYIAGGQPTPAYYAERMVSATFRGNVLAPAGVPTGFSVYASYDAGSGVTAILVLNKTTTSSRLTLAVEGLPVQSFDFPATSLTMVQIPDAAGSASTVLRYTAERAAASMPPESIQ